MALSMLLSICAVFGSAYEPYKDAAITSREGYNDVDKPMFTTEQYATMAADELDRMLAEEQLYLTEDDIFVGELDLRSVNQTLSSVGTLIDSADQLLPLLGTAQQLTIDSLYYNKASKVMLKRQNVADGNSTDLNIILKLISFLNDNTDVLCSYVDGTINLGILDSVIADFKFNIRNILMGLLAGIMDDDVDWETYVPDKTLDALLQELVEYAMVGVYEDTGSELILSQELGNDGKMHTVQRGIIWNFLDENPVPYNVKKDIIANTINICNTNKNAYDFIEKLMRDAFDYVAVPELNNVTRPWLRETAGIVYDKDKMDPNKETYVPNYDGEPWTAETVEESLAAIFDLDDMRIPTYSEWLALYPAKSSTPFIENFNDFLGYAATLVLKGTQYTTDQRDANGYFWDYTQGNDALFNNIGSLARYVLQNCGDFFFPDYIHGLLPQQYAQMENQQIYAFVVRTILNASVDWMYVPDTCNTLADVCYEAVAQLAWQDIPQFTYTKPTNNGNDEAYREAIVDKALTILMDVAIYGLNQETDMNPDKRQGNASPANNSVNGLLKYQGDTGSWTVNALQVATWGVHNYGKMLTSDGCTLDAIQLDKNNDGRVTGTTITDAWEDIDLIVNSIIPLSSTLEGSSKTWISSVISAETNSEGGSDVVRSIIFDYIVLPLLRLDGSGLNELLTKNPTGTFALDTIKQVLIDLIKDVLNLIFPGTLTQEFTNFDGILQNSVLAGMVRNLLGSFNIHGEEWASVALPVVCDLLDLTASQEFDKMNCLMPSNINASDANANDVSFQVFNGCSGLNTYSVNEMGVGKQDNLYKYKIDSVSCVTSGAGAAANSVSATGLAKNDILNGGDNTTITLSGTFVNGSVIELTIKYQVIDENNEALADGTILACTRYAYVGAVAEDDSDYKVDTVIAPNLFTLKTSPSVYLNRGRGISGVESYNIALKREDADKSKNNNDLTATLSDYSGPAWLQLNTDTSKTTAVTKKDGGTYAFTPFQLVDGYTRATYSYNKVNLADQEALDTAMAANTIYVQNEQRQYVPAGATYSEDAVYYIKTTNTTGPDTYVQDGVYDASFKMNVNGTSTTVNVRIFLYDDYGLESYYNSAVTANRQDTDFTNARTEWNNYKTALQNAGNMVLAPNNYTTFAANMNNNVAAGYPNKYAELYDALADAIEALDEKAAGANIDTLKQAVESVVGTSNSTYTEDGWVNKEYYEDGYSFFGRRDFVPHTYIRFDDALDRAQDLINKVTVYPPVEPENPGVNASVYDYNNYLKAKEAYDLEYAAYLEKLENLPTLDPVDVAYALHMVNLTGGRLISLPGNTSKLATVVALYGQVSAKGNYSDKTWTNYTNAKNFANKTLQESEPKPSQITTALSELVEAYKKLNEGCDYTELLAVMEEANAVTEADWTAESYAALQKVLSSAIELCASDLSKSDANQDKIDKKASELEAAVNALVPAGAGGDDVVYEITTEDFGVFFDESTFMMTFVPFENTMIEELGFDWNLDESEKPKYMSGLGVYVDPSYIDCIFPAETLKGCYAAWEENEYGAYGTGAYINIYSTADDSLLDSYRIFIYGDVTGDAAIDNADSAWIDRYGGEMWNGNEYSLYAAAGDVTGDYSCDTTDGIYIDKVPNSQVQDYQDGTPFCFAWELG